MGLNILKTIDTLQLTRVGNQLLQIRQHAFTAGFPGAHLTEKPAHPSNRLRHLHASDQEEHEERGTKKGQIHHRYRR